MKPGDISSSDSRCSFRCVSLCGAAEKVRDVLSCSEIFFFGKLVQKMNTVLERSLRG